MDKGNYWRVEGSWNRDGLMEGFAEFFLSIGKSDGRVTDIGEVMRFTPHSSVLSLTGRHLAGKTSEQMTAEPDVVLRNDIGDIIAIYDVKTLDAELWPKRVRRFRAATRVDPSVYVIDLHVERGATLKFRWCW